MFIHRLTGEKIVDPRQLALEYQSNAEDEKKSGKSSGKNSAAKKNTEKNAADAAAPKAEERPNPSGADDYGYDEDDENYEEYDQQQQNYDEEIPEPEEKEKVGSKSCSANEEWKECGSACPPTCLSPKPEICIKNCISGCFCKEGFLLHEGDCIAKTDCPGKKMS